MIGNTADNEQRPAGTLCQF